MTPSPSLRHQLVVTQLLRRFEEAARAAGGLMLTAPLDVHLPGFKTVQPDLIYLSPAQLPLIPAHGPIEVAPELVVEVLSPATARRDRGEKLAAYAGSGVRECWLVDPAVRRIELLVRRSGAGSFTAVPWRGGRYRSRVLPELTLDVAGLWAEIEARGPRRAG